MAEQEEESREDTGEGATGDGATVIVFKGYLVKLAERERLRPDSVRLEVPTIVEIAKAIGIHPITMNDIVNNHVTRLNMDTVTRIIGHMRRLGFPTTLSDFMEYYPPDDRATAGRKRRGDA
jgi:hypothetical protein